MKRISLINNNNVDDIIEGLDEEIRSMMQESYLSPIDYRMIYINAALLEMVRFLRERHD